jgi:hypothetical protein
MNKPEPKQVVYTPVDIDDADFAEFSHERTEEEIDFEKFRDEMREANQYAKITISRQPTTSDGRPGQQKLIFLFECGMDEFSFSQLCSRCRDEYGTGTYRIQARNEKGQLKINKAIQVEAPKLGNESHDANNPAEIITRFSEAMHQHQNRTEQMMTKFIAPQTGGDAFDQMTKMMTAMGGVMSGMGITPQQPKSMLDQLTEFKMLKELFGGDSDSGGDANLYSLLTATMQSFGAPIAAAIAMGQQTGALDSAGVLTPPALPNPNPETETDAEKQVKVNEAMKANIAVLIKNAQANTDPAQFAGVLIANLPDDKMDEFYDFISADDYLQRLVSLVPEVETYKNWFIKLRDTVIELLTEPVDEHIVAPSVAEVETPPTDTVISDDTDSKPASDS